MCGIVAILNVKEQTHELREQALKMSQKIRHRGPDWSGIYSGGSAILAHERLSVDSHCSHPTGNRSWLSMARFTTIRISAAAMPDSMSSRRAPTVR